MRHVRRILVLTALAAVAPAAAAAAAPAPVLHVVLKAQGIPSGTPLRDGHRTFDVPYRTLVFATATLIDSTAGTSTAGIPVRVTGDLVAQGPAVTTNAGGAAVLRLKPRVTTAYTFDVPSLPGIAAQHVTLRVSPGWKVGARFPVRHGRFVVSGRLLAATTARADGSYVNLQRRTRRGWVTVKRLAISRSLLVSARLPKAAYTGRKMRFVYVSKTADYIRSTRVFTVRAESAENDGFPPGDGGTTNFGGDFGGNGGLADGGDGTCAGC